MDWLRIFPSDASELQCPRCGNQLDATLPSLDHHPRMCSACRGDLLIFSTSQHGVVVDVANAPAEFAAFIHWCRANFDELQFVSLMAYLEEFLASDRSAAVIQKETVQSQ